MEELMIKIDNVTKQYKLGQIGGTTLRDELQRMNARLRHKEDPTKKIGAKDYNRGETFMALNGVSFEVRKGERVGIIGHNGAGKSTLLKLLSRVTAPTSGEIGLNGRIASMLEVGTGFHPELTGRENVYMNGAILGMTKKEIDAKIEDIIEFSECRQFIDTPVKRYSSGMYVKLAFSVAAHLDSEIMIMDEVLAVGDMAFQQKCLDKMNDVSRSEGRTILYVSHNMNTIRQLCDRVVVLDHGTVVFDGEVEEGIIIYSGCGRTAATFSDCTQIPHEKNANGKMFIQSASLLKLAEPVIFRDLSLGIKYKSDISCSKTKIRIILFCDDSPIGMTVTPFEFSSAVGDNFIDIAIDCASLSGGQYFCRIVLFEETELGGEAIFDVVHNAISFCKDNSKLTGVSGRWNNKIWGNNVLPPIQLVEGHTAE